MRRNNFDKLKLFWAILRKRKNPRPVFRCGLYDIGDDANVHLIFPTRQAPATRPRLSASAFKRNHWAPDDIAAGPTERKEAIDVFRCSAARDPVGLLLSPKPSP